MITFISTLIFNYSVTSLIHHLCHEELADVNYKNIFVLLFVVASVLVLFYFIN